MANMSRSNGGRGTTAASLKAACRAAAVAGALAPLLAFVTPSARAALSASIVPGTLTQGTVQASLTGGSYANEGSNLGDWPLDTGSFGGSVFPVSIGNSDFNGNSFGGTPNTVVAFGNGGGVTLKFSGPVTPATGRKDLGIFTAQELDGFGTPGSFFNGNMEAAILVSADGNNWRTLTGATVMSPTTYTATAYHLNAPAVAYNFGTLATAWNDSSGASPSGLAALPIANYTTPMPNDNVFNGTGTNADRNALTTDASPSDYAAIFGSSGGGNWFDLSGSGLSQINYVRLNGDANDPSDGGVRLDGVFANSAATPEPASLSLLCSAGGVMLLRRRRR